jgi:polynucleotide 5'-kinase involved in rRNA processing
VDEFATNKPYYDKCFIYRQNKLKKMDRQLECVFITGASHTGKTSFAKMIANAK